MLCLPEHCCHYGPSNMTIVEYASGHLLKPGPSGPNVEGTIRWINLHPVDNAIGFPNTYPLDSDLSSE